MSITTKAVIAGVSVFVIPLVVNFWIGTYYNNRIIDQSQKSVSISSVLVTLGNIKTSISEYYGIHGRLPENNRELGMGEPETFSGRWIRSVTIGPGGKIAANLKDANDDARLYFYPTENTNQFGMALIWRCFAQGIRQDILDSVYSPICISIENNKELPVTQHGKIVPKVDDLIKAIREKNNGLVKHLIKQHVDVNGRNEMGESPLRTAIEDADNYVVQQLIAAGAEVDEVIEHQKKKTLLMLATEHRIHGSLKIRQLLNAGALIEARDETNKTALIHAAINNDHEAVQVLMKFNADTKSVDFKGQTAENYAALLHGKDSKVYQLLTFNQHKPKEFIYRLPE